MSASAERETRITTSLKMLPSQKERLTYAASLKGKNRSEFILESALQKADDTVLEQTVFHLGAEQFAAFESALAEPVDQDAVADLFSKKAPWD